jgi:iron complex outermembrane receptor protein
MIRTQHQKPIPPLCCSLLATLAGGALLAPGLHAQDTNAPTEMKPTVVTGSYIPTAETVGAAPVQSLSSENIIQAGTADPLLTLKKLVPSFTGSGNYLGSVNNNVNIGAGFQAFTGQSYVSLRNLPTLVLIDGQRVVSTALSGGQSVDLNTIPLAMIERIEVLKDGASAIYGSDAIGGVVNIITKKNWSGFEVGGRYGFPTEGPGESAWQYKAYVIGGTTTDTSRFTAGAQEYVQNSLLTKDRNFASYGPAELVAHGIQPAVAYLSPSFPGKIQQSGEAWILAGSPFAQGRPGYNPAITTPPRFGTNVFSTVTAYNAYAATNGFPGGVYLPFDTTTLLNTTDFGTTSVLDQERRQFWANFEQDLFKDTLTVYSRFMYSDNTAHGELAPSPVIALYNPAAGYNIAVPGNNPYNPFGIDLGLDGSQSPRIRSRFVESGNRLFDSFQDTYMWVGGLKGKITPDYSYDASFDYSKSREEQQTRNAINGAALNQALDPLLDAAGNYVLNAQGRPLSHLLDFNGNNVPVYNFFAGSLARNSGINSPDTLNAIRTTLFTWGESELWNAQGVFTGTPIDLPAGKLSFAAGGQFIHEGIQLQVDGLTQSGFVPGLNPQANFNGGTRETAAGFIEVNIPVLGKDQDIPMFHSFEITAAGRYQTFDPGGDAWVPKVAVRWQPLDEQFTIRGSYGQGFIAPSIWTLFGPDFVSNPAISTSVDQGQVNTTTRANPNLQPQDSEQYGVGIVISPKAIKNLTFGVDYYHAELTKVPVADAQGAANSLNALGVNSPYAPGFTFFDGTRLTTAAPNQVTVGNWGNLIIPWSGGGGQRVEGLDFSGNYVLPLPEPEKYGKVTLDTVANLTISHELSTGTGRPFHEYKGTYTTLQGLIPDYNITTSLAYDWKNFTYVISAHFLPGATDPGNLFPEYGGTEHGLTISGHAYQIPAYFTIDMQLSYEFGRGKLEGRKWYDGTRLTIGCNNVTNEKPPLIPSSPEDNIDKNNYDNLGPFIYFEVAKKF